MQSRCGTTFLDLLALRLDRDILAFSLTPAFQDSLVFPHWAQLLLIAWVPLAHRLNPSQTPLGSFFGTGILLSF